MLLVWPAGSSEEQSGGSWCSALQTTQSDKQAALSDCYIERPAAATRTAIIWNLLIVAGSGYLDFFEVQSFFENLERFSAL